MTQAGIRPFCKKQNNNIGCFESSRIQPRDFTEWNLALCMYKSHTCPIWKSNGISSNKTIEELNLHLKIVDNCISGKHFKSFIKYENKPKRVQTQSTNMVVYDKKIFNIDRAVPYSICMYELRKNSSK